MAAAVYFPWAITSKAKAKRRSQQHTRKLVMSLAPALNALAFDIQDQLGFAVIAINGKRSCAGAGRHPKQPLIAFTHWALNPAIFHVYYTTAGFVGQYIFLLFVLCSQKIYMVSSTNKYNNVQFSAM